MSTTILSARFVTCLLGLLLAGIGSVARAQEQPESKVVKSEPAMKRTAGAGESEFSDRLKLANQATNVVRRLPRYFASVVDQKQRLRIYEIQTSYRAKLEEIEQQLAELRASQMRDIEQVLTPTQLQRIEELRSQPRSLATSNPSGSEPLP